MIEIEYPFWKSWPLPSEPPLTQEELQRRADEYQREQIETARSEQAQQEAERNARR